MLLTRANFGCGSSREHAVWATRDFGVRVIMAPSYSDIFYNNCVKNGVLPVTLVDARINDLFELVKRKQGYRLTVDLQEKVITDEFGLSQSFEIDDFRRRCLLLEMGEIGLTLDREAEIAAYEKSCVPHLTNK